VKYKVKKGAMNSGGISKLIEFAETLNYTPCSTWLGYYKEKVFYLGDMSKEDVPKILHSLAPAILGKLSALGELSEDNLFNQIVIKKYAEGDEGKPHFDPRDIKGKVVAIHFGDFELSTVRFDGEEVMVDSGDVIIRQATSGYTMGPKYNVSAVEGGTKYVLEFQTITKEKPS
jgi:hypothetical protein